MLKPHGWMHKDYSVIEQWLFKVSYELDKLTQLTEVPKMSVIF